MGSVASLQCWDARLTPGLAQWVKDSELPQLRFRSQSGSDLIPGLETPHAEGDKRKEEKIEREKKFEKRGKDSSIHLPTEWVGAQVIASQ